MQRALQPERAESARRAQRRGPSLAPPPPLPASLPEWPRPASVGAPPPSQSRRTALPAEPMAALSARGHLTQGAVVIRRGEAGGARQRGWAPAGSRWRERGRERARAPGRPPPPLAPSLLPGRVARSRLDLLARPVRGLSARFPGPSHAGHSWGILVTWAQIPTLLLKWYQASHSLNLSMPQPPLLETGKPRPPHKLGFWKPLSRAWLEAPRNCISTGSPNQPLSRSHLPIPQGFAGGLETSGRCCLPLSCPLVAAEIVARDRDSSPSAPASSCIFLRTLSLSAPWPKKQYGNRCRGPAVC
ncbi:serine/threonine-protein kinase LMTK3-like [Peromyscus leucopus]|uniref:serine/threonine-protein kinase LMTK3-like n=1 Tax=Peromyscus leucopus TaxID=10041 RepID=UPI0018849FFE|nr:serine/threonine-protein kinase LMTK3-like [Peromyscus leucopus]